MIAKVTILLKLSEKSLMLDGLASEQRCLFVSLETTQLSSSPTKSKLLFDLFMYQRSMNDGRWLCS